MTILLSCDGISKSHGSLLLFRNLSFSIFKGDRIGVVGPNGAGKSTFLKILTDVESPDTGVVSARKTLRLAYVPQESNFPDLSVEKILIHAMADTSLEDHEKDVQVDIILSKLGFTDPKQIASTLSGGWKKRLEIAKALVNEPELIFFDEPTNHLDLEGILWLEKFLQQAQFSYLVISHDRYFLENVTNRTLELNKSFPNGIFCIDGTFSNFLEKKEEYLSGQEQYQRALNSKVRREIDWLRQTPQARTTKSQSRIQEAHRLIAELDEVKFRNKKTRAKIDFVGTERETRKLLTATNISKAYEDKELFSGIHLTLSPGTRLGIVGMNGTGKSTLLKILGGIIKPDRGTIKYAEDIKIVYFDQHREQLPPNITLRTALSPTSDMVNYRGQSIHVNSWCKRFLFSPDRLDMPISQLSGGERARILIARLMLKPADVLLLDEPTNDLDIPTLETLEESLEDYPGALVLITHDRYMLDQMSNIILGLGTHDENEYFADYLQWEDYQSRKTKPSKKIEDKSSFKQIENELPKSTKKLNYHERKELDEMEANILKAETALTKAQRQMDDPGIAMDAHKLQEACQHLHDTQECLDKLYARWQQLEDKQV